MPDKIKRKSPIPKISRKSPSSDSAKGPLPMKNTSKKPVSGSLSLARHNKSERAAEPTGKGPKTEVKIVRGRETTVPTGQRGALSFNRANANAKRIGLNEERKRKKKR